MLDFFLIIKNDDNLNIKNDKNIDKYFYNVINNVNMTS